MLPVDGAGDAASAGAGGGGGGGGGEQQRGGGAWKWPAIPTLKWGPRTALASPSATLAAARDSAAELSD
eukprot:gene5867-4722_t